MQAVQSKLTTPLRRAYAQARGLRSFVRFVGDLGRLDDVLGMADGMRSDAAGQALVDAIQATPAGARAIAERYVLAPDPLRLAQLTAGTLGHAYGTFMAINGLSPRAIPAIGTADTMSYVRTHLRETHDLWHVLTGFDTQPDGELGLQAFYLAQLPFAPGGAILAGGLLNMALHAPKSRVTRMTAIAAGWTRGQHASPLFGVRYGDMWELPLADVREQLGLAMH
jgi:ubiquinone biosynthesis protein COQ4